MREEKSGQGGDKFESEKTDWDHPVIDHGFLSF